MTSKPEGPWLTRWEAADRLRVSPRTIDAWAKDGKITKYRVSGLQSVRFDQHELDALVVVVEKTD